MDGHDNKCCRKIAENCNRLSIGCTSVTDDRRHTYIHTDRQTDRQTDGRQQIANVNVSSRSLKRDDYINFRLFNFFNANAYYTQDIQRLNSRPLMALDGHVLRQSFHFRATPISSHYRYEYAISSQDRCRVSLSNLHACDMT